MDTLFLLGEVSLETKKDNDATTSQKFGSQNLLAHLYMAIRGLSFKMIGLPTTDLAVLIAFEF